MKTQKRTKLFMAAVAISTLFVYSCTRSGPCEGSLTLENPIPDITVAVGDTVYIDLSNPQVFVSSEGRVSYSFGMLSGLSKVDLNRIANPEDEDNFTLLLVIGEAEGEATAELRAASDCLENSLTFNITVTEQ